MAERYYITRTSKKEGKRYKRYKTIEGWASDKTHCWKFSKQGAKKIVEGLNAGAARSKFYKSMPELMPTYGIEEAAE